MIFCPSSMGLQVLGFRVSDYQRRGHSNAPGDSCRRDYTDTSGSRGEAATAACHCLVKVVMRSGNDQFTHASTVLVMRCTVVEAI